MAIVVRGLAEEKKRGGHQHRKSSDTNGKTTVTAPKQLVRSVRKVLKLVFGTKKQ